MDYELISINEYKKRFNVGYEKIKQMISSGEIEVKGKKIVIYKKFVPIEMYEKVIVENTKLKTIIQNTKMILKEVN